MNDRKTYQQLIGDFVPPRVFDAHAHFYRLQDVGDGDPRQAGTVPEIAGYDQWLAAQMDMMGDSAPRDGLFFAFPGPKMDMAAANSFVLEQVRDRPGSRALIMIDPQDDPDQLGLDDGWAGFKVYHAFSGNARTQDALIDQFLPDWAWEIADQRGWSIMLHLVRMRSLADPVNTRYITDHCRRFPNARLILAHAGRGFAGHHTVEGLSDLTGLDNLFFDTSAVCEPVAMWHILKQFGPRRLLYGSDYPISNWRGKAISIGDGFFWLYEQMIDWSNWDLGAPTLAGIESLHAIKLATQMTNLADADIECVFYNNAAELFGLNQQDGV